MGRCPAMASDDSTNRPDTKSSLSTPGTVDATDKEGEAGKTRREMAAFYLAAGHSPAWVARRIGRSRRTVHRWLSRPPFRRMVSAFRGRIFDRATGRLCSVAAKSADVLAGLLASESEAVRL